MDKPKIAEKKLREKPAKPYTDFPLFPHNSGQWAKTVRGKMRYFGVWADWKAALDRWLEQRDALFAGREPSPDNGGMTLGELVVLCLAAKQAALKTGELGARTLADYSLTWDRVLDVFRSDREVASLGPPDFTKLRAAFAETHKAVALTADIRRTNVLFNWGRKNYDIGPRCGTAFDKPSRAAMRKARSSRAKKLFTREEILKLVQHAGRNLRAMIWLGINCAFGNDDCAKLTVNHLDLEAGWHWLPRHKTGIERGSPLWPETVEALRAVLADRPTPKRPELADRVFLTLFGNSFEGSQKNNPISKEMAKLMIELGVHQKSRGFYALRHTFQTHARRTKDLITVHYFTGHADSANDMDATYNEEIFDEDLIAVSDFVRAWLLFPTDSDASSLASGESRPAGVLRLYAPGMPEARPRTPDNAVAGNRAG